MIEAAGAVFDHNHLVDCLAHAFGKDACDRVSTAARRERQDQTNWTRRIIVCARSTRITMPPTFGVTQNLAHFIATTRWDDIPPLEHFSIRFGVPRVCEISFAFFFGNTFEKKGDCSPKLLNCARLHFA